MERLLSFLSRSLSQGFIYYLVTLTFNKEYSIAMSLKYPWHGNKIAPCCRDRFRILTCRHTFLWAYTPMGGEELTANSVSAWRVVHWEYSKAVVDYITRTGTCRDKSVFSHGLWVLMPNKIAEIKSLQNSSSQRLIFYDDDQLKVIAYRWLRSDE